MKVLVVGDIHGRHEYVTSAFNKFLEEKYDKIIFIGDIADSYDRSNEDILRCFNIMLSIKRSPRAEDAIYLIGNHDEQYFDYGDSYRCQGFRQDLHFQLSHLLTGNTKHFKAAHSIGKYLFTHAGVTQSWYLAHFNVIDKWATRMGLDVTNIEDLGSILEGISSTCDKPILFEIGPERSGWKNGLGGPMWCDKAEMLDHFPIAGLHQVVGHTPVHFITRVAAFGSKRDITFKDTSVTFIDVLSYKQQFLTIEI